MWYTRDVPDKMVRLFFVWEKAMQGNVPETPPVIVENVTTIVETPPEPEPIIEPDYSEEAIRELDAWCASIEAQIEALRLAIGGLAPGEHSHDNYAATEHEHGYAATEHGHEEFALREHEHASTPGERQDEPPKPTHPWFRKIGEY
jgi:hypothetical protein